MRFFFYKWDLNKITRANREGLETPSNAILRKEIFSTAKVDSAFCELPRQHLSVLPLRQYFIEKTLGNINSQFPH